VRDPNYGDEAYDLRSDPTELVNLLGPGGTEPADVAALRDRVDRWEDECIELRDRLGVGPGFRGFDQWLVWRFVHRQPVRLQGILCSEPRNYPHLNPLLGEEQAERKTASSAQVL
jgi:hypothetical protein